MPRRFTRAVRVAEIAGAIAAVVVLAILFVPRLSSGGNAATPGIEQPDLNVAVVPAVDSAGFFVAMHQGLFAAHGLHVTFVPAVSSATVINARWAKPMDEGLIAEHAAGKRLVVTAEESAAMGGFGDGVLDALNRADIRMPVLKIALAEGFVHHGAVDDLRRQQRIDAPGMLEQVREALGSEAPSVSRSKVSAA